MTRHVRRSAVAAAVLTVALGVTLAAKTARIVQTNSAGDNISLIDPGTNRVVGEIHGIEVNHGAAVTPDGARFFFSNEADHTLDVVDGRSLKVTKQIALSGRPNNIAIAKDGSRVYVSIASGKGAVDVIDARGLTLLKSIPLEGAAHNTYVTPDGRYIVVGSVAGKRLTVIDQKTEQPLWSLAFDAGVRPMAFDTDASGTPQKIYVQLSDFHGFAVVDFNARRELSRVTLPEVPPEQRHTQMLQGSPSHGIGIAPDGKTLWVNSKLNSYVYAYSLPDLKLLGGVHVGDHPDWLTFSPDGKAVYIANAGSNSVSVVDVAARREVTRIPGGQVPKRNITAVLP